MASCATTTTTAEKKTKPRSKEYFAESEYGVKASPRVIADGQPVPRGGGRQLVGDPYQVKGKTYVPKEDPNYNKSGLASWYGSAFHGRLTANGEVYDTQYISAAHPTFPLPSYARVTNLDTGTSLIVRVNDRGPYHPGRIIDVSDKAAELLDFRNTGTAHVNVQYVGRARMDGRDMPFMMASYVRKGERLPRIGPEGQIATGVMVASNQSFGDQLQSYGRSGATPVANAQAAKTQPTRTSAALAAATQTYTSPSKPSPVVAPVLAERSEPVGKVAAAPVAVPPAHAQQQVRPMEVARLEPVRPAVVAQPVAAAQAAKPKAVAVAPVQQAPMQAQAPAPRKTAPSAQLAYSPAPKASAPQVVFGNVVLRDDGVLQTTGDVPQNTTRQKIANR